ncbi:MAG: transcription termination/antitermination protein NusA [Chlamydiales bacterium]|nr:transcription termination/antitermination protein NusA [Chlamydiales bacterium]
MNKDLLAIFEYLEREKGIKREIVVKAIEDALRIAARKSIKHVGDINVSINSKTGDIEATTEKEIVENVEYPEEEISLESARELDPDCEIGQWIQVEVNPEELGRIAAQTAKQVITQKLRGAERDVIYEEYRHRIHEIVSGTVKKVTKGNTLIVDLGKVQGVLPGKFYPITEKYGVGDKVQAMIFEVRDTENGGAEVILTRSHPEIVKQLFLQEVPECSDGLINIVKIVREAGYRTKMLVTTNDAKIDPVGACVGVRGTRVKNIIKELNNEKIDILPYSDDLQDLLTNILSPVVPKKMDVDDNDTIILVVADEDYPTVLGKKGCNARLIAELIEHEVKVYKQSEYGKQELFERKQIALMEDPTLDEVLSIEGVNPLILDSITTAGYDTPRKILTADIKTISEETKLSEEKIGNIVQLVKNKVRASNKAE